MEPIDEEDANLIEAYKQAKFKPHLFFNNSAPPAQSWHVRGWGKNPPTLPNGTGNIAPIPPKNN